MFMPMFFYFKSESQHQYNKFTSRQEIVYFRNLCDLRLFSKKHQEMTSYLLHCTK